MAAKANQGKALSKAMFKGNLHSEARQDIDQSILTPLTFVTATKNVWATTCILCRLYNVQ
jgi:hypothetical protein